MTVASTTASLVCNITLIWDFIMTKDFRKNGESLSEPPLNPCTHTSLPSGSGLTEKQRSLVIAVMILLCYIGLGSLVFSFLIVTPHLTFIDSLYFTVCTVTSVGFGDITPTSTASRIFSFPYDIVGLAILAFTIAIARETVIETFEANYRMRREILAKKARERKEEKRKRDKERRERRVREASGGPVDRGGYSLPPITIGGQPMGSRLKRWASWLWRWVGRAKEETAGINPLGMTRTLTATSLVQEETYKTFKKQMQKEQDKEFRMKIGVAIILFAMFWFVRTVLILSLWILH
jgi:potassium channel subfamily K